MDLHGLIKTVQHHVRSNSPAYLAGLAISGVVGTAYLAGKAGFRTARRLSEEAPDSSIQEKAKMTWTFYIPAALVGVGTVACVVGATKIGYRRTAALTAAYSLSERAFSEYKEAVVEKLGERKEQTIRDGLAQDKVKATAPSREIVLYGAGSVLCCELHTGRFFLCDMDVLKKSQNEINAKLIRDDYAYLADFHHMIGITQTQGAYDFGWKSDKLLELEFSTVLADETRPCLAFGYNYLKML